MDFTAVFFFITPIPTTGSRIGYGRFAHLFGETKGIQGNPANRTIGYTGLFHTTANLATCLNIR